MFRRNKNQKASQPRHRRVIDSLDRTERRRPGVVQWVWVAAGVLGVAAAGLLIHYAVQTQQLRTQLDELRQVAQLDPAPTASMPTLASVENAAETPPDVQGSVTNAEQAATDPPAPILAPTRDFAALQRRNSDIHAWLEYPGIRDIDLPVVIRDNTFYMTHDYLGRKNVSGSIFADQRNVFSPRDDNLVLYGHNMKNGTMFGKMYRLMDTDLFAKDPFFVLETAQQREVYVPYAIALTDHLRLRPRHQPGV